MKMFDGKIWNFSWIIAKLVDIRGKNILE